MKFVLRKTDFQMFSISVSLTSETGLKKLAKLNYPVQNIPDSTGGGNMKKIPGGQPHPEIAGFVAVSAFVSTGISSVQSCFGQ